MRNRKILATVIFTLIMLTVIGLVVYEYVTTNTVDKDTVLRALLVIAGGIIGMVKIFSGMGGKIPYQKYENIRKKAKE